MLKTNIQKSSLVLNKGYSTSTIYKKKTLGQKAKYSFRKHWQLYLVIIPSVLYFIIFKYIPMFGTIIAFKDYSVVQGIWGSPWAGLKYFKLFFNNPMAWSLIKNTLFLSLYHILVSFPLPILLALALNEIRQGVFKKTVQMVTYAPYFISTVVLVSMIIMMTSPRLGVINHILVALGFHSVNFMGDPNLFRSIYVWSDAWQNTGYSAVVYLAALAGVDPSLYEAAKMDGASRIQKILHIDLPGIMPAMVIILILTIGNLMAVGFEKIYLLQNPLNLGVSEVLATYVFKMGLLNANYSLAAAIGLFNSLVNLILILISNFLAKRVTGNGLW
ncbi:ABC transporter permease subunit [Pullulanibacillus sp. KACC 23026]|uniref:ABC transporter permease n=1 Tax=Pullulanibacillus sp. KACC 23026 TaxID=3028315 RepID=UPI0023B0D6F7|nr:ABC transporter permease subunit [Pullulanibacillus sp. KACC 23026]WEG11078.1 ABC transporter permease subunit [Pullulanibacillus sp. KACC 23026]